MAKPVSTTKKPRKQHTPEFCQEAPKLAERIGVVAAAREFSLYESQLYNWRGKQQNQLSSSEREQEMSAEIARLKRQLAERNEELAILQKATTYFAKRLNYGGMTSRIFAPMKTGCIWPWLSTCGRVPLSAGQCHPGWREVGGHQRDVFYLA